MKLTPHEKTILELISKHPDIVDSPSARKLIAKQYGFSEKTLRKSAGDARPITVESLRGLRVVSPSQHN